MRKQLPKTERRCGKLAQRDDLCFECWQIGLNGLPDDGQIDIEIAMCQRVAHFVGEAPWHGGLLSRKVRVILGNVVARLANHFKVANHSVCRVENSVGLVLIPILGFKGINQEIGL